MSIKSEPAATGDPAVEREPTPTTDLGDRLPRYLVEMVVGLALAALIVLALVATVGSVPFIYQGF